MIVFGTGVTDRVTYERYAAPGIARVSERDSIALTRTGTTLQAAYNSILAEVAPIDALEAVVLLHQDTAIIDAEFTSKVRAALSDPRVSVVGTLGARDVRGIAWWKGRTFGQVGAPGASLDGTYFAEVSYGWHEVEAIDGLLLILSPFAARTARFDERFAPVFHGYDVDFCFEVRARGGRCVVGPIAATHYGTAAPFPNPDWIRADLLWQRKWAPGGESPPPRGLLWT
jgi:GT2 family glycosyltransferase